MSTLLTVKQVKSLTVGFAFPETYDTGRIEEIKVYLGKNVYPHTIDGRVVKCQIKSDDTAVMYGANRLSFWLDDSIIGIYPVYCGDIVFEYTNAIEHNESVNTGFDLLVNLAISETAITVDNVLYDYFKGDKGDTGKYGETKFVINDNMELEQHTLIGDPLNFSLVDDELVLTEGGETVNLGKVVIKDTYSYDEIQIGTWVNGKPIYRKVFLFPNPDINDTISIVHNLNVDTYIRMDIASNCFNMEYQASAPLLVSTTPIQTNMLVIDQDTIILQSVTVNTAYTYHLIIEYTKL